MGYKYVHINSVDRQRHEQTSKMRVELNEPIHNAISCKVVSASMANEFFNVNALNNRINLVILNLVSGSIDTTTIRDIPIEITPGVLTAQEIIDEFNTKMAALPPEGKHNTTVTMTLLASQKVQINGESATNKNNRLILYYRNSQKGFFSSVLHRLGFSRSQVSPDLPQITAVGEPSIILPFTDLLGFNVREYNTTISNITNSDLLVLKTNVTNGHTRISNNIAFESISLIYIKSDDLVKHSTKTINNDNSISSTTYTGILQVVHVNVNLFSWINFYGTDNAFVHSLDGRTISSFEISIEDETHTVFQHQHFKDFNITLLFETADREEDNYQLNQRQVLALHDKGFKMRHCL